jgi:hypothetical protein
MLTCYAGGGCENVLGAPAESFIHTSLLDGLHAEDVRNLVFAFHLFPTILPEVINRVGAPRSTARKPRKDGVRRSGAEGGADDKTPKENPAETPAAGSEPWAKEREKMRARAALDVEGVLPLPDAAQLLPHGYLRRRLADGRFVAMERLGGMIVSNDTAASVLREAREALRGGALHPVRGREQEPGEQLAARAEDALALLAGESAERGGARCRARPPRRRRGGAGRAEADEPRRDQGCDRRVRRDGARGQECKGKSCGGRVRAARAGDGAAVPGERRRG